MGAETNQEPLVVIVGETASGKSALAMEISRRFGGEIIAADSRTVYCGMDVGTAKPGADDRQAVPHHLLDVTTPDRPITAFDFKALASKSIKEIASKGKLPVMAGGTGLYIDSVIYDFRFRSPSDAALRCQLQQLGIEELHGLMEERGVPLPNNERNPRHLVRQLETGGVSAGRSPKIRHNTLVIGMQIDRELLKARIASRVNDMLNEGLEEEARTLSRVYGWDVPAMHTIGYWEFREYFEGKKTYEQVYQDIVHNTWRYAKRQRTWFRRNKNIHWISKTEEAVDLVTTFLNK